VNYILFCHLHVLFSPCCNKARADSRKSRSISLAKVFIANSARRTITFHGQFFHFVVDGGSSLLVRGGKSNSVADLTQCLIGAPQE
jgi:hypothetical protein